MPQLDGTGPEKKGTQTGRGLGKCKVVPEKEALEKLGKGWVYVAKPAADREKINA